MRLEKNGQEKATAFSCRNVAEEKQEVVREDTVKKFCLLLMKSNLGWVIDSGATQHMTGEKSRLANYVEFKQPCKVTLGDDRTICALGKGTYVLVAALGNGRTQNISLKERLHLPELKKNVLSVQAMGQSVQQFNLTVSDVKS